MFKMNENKTLIPIYERLGSRGIQIIKHMLSNYEIKGKAILVRGRRDV
jgi:hypothetical protein